MNRNRFISHLVMAFAVAATAIALHAESQPGMENNSAAIRHDNDKQQATEDATKVTKADIQGEAVQKEKGKQTAALNTANDFWVGCNGGFRMSDQTGRGDIYFRRPLLA
jgi:hypothetical protein